MKQRVLIVLSSMALGLLAWVPARLWPIIRCPPHISLARPSGSMGR